MTHLKFTNNKIIDLNLDGMFRIDGSFTENHKKAIEKYKNIRSLSLNALFLHSLKNFPAFPELSKLEIRQNKLTGEDFKIIASRYPNLNKLKLAENKITSFEVLECLVFI